MYSSLVVVLCLQLYVSLCDQGSFCPDFTATFVGVIDQTSDEPTVITDDPRLTFLKEIMGFRDEDIQHAFEDAAKFYNDTYGLDFFSQPNEKNEYFFGNAKMSPFRFYEGIHYRLALSNWIQTGNTRFTCQEIEIGGHHVIFTGDQLLHGSYGGVDGIPVGEGDFLQYGYNRFDVCDQSPVIVQIETSIPIRQEPVDGGGFLHFDTYNNVLGHGKALGTFTMKPDKENPGKFHLVTRNVFTFPAI